MFPPLSFARLGHSTQGLVPSLQGLSKEYIVHIHGFIAQESSGQRTGLLSARVTPGAPDICVAPGLMLSAACGIPGPGHAPA